MKAIKATYMDGQITLSELPAFSGPTEVMVVFPDATDDPWHRILDDATPRPTLSARIKDVEAEIREGKARALKRNKP